ncbi:LysR family transcriptional regulator [Shewanella sp. Isolate11]|uniref:LysR family transcriptional regulator n=1 Tax=Shewanella sp. Isolate11 TaxID=2908530 RepID=UPI001EFD9214|nr:LysR family transcriptional regulator [Shewanella sp. Isolate11]MCG9695668.1 LysR family transcriptional regulator [Shewanella sp. Isolate11]
MKDVNLDNLDMLSANILVNLYETHSATSVADNMNIPAPKVSRCLQHARVMFNNPLFIRKKYGLEPNEFTRQLYPIVKELVQCAEHLYQFNEVKGLDYDQPCIIYVSDLLIPHLPQQLSRAICQEHQTISYELRSESVDPLADIDAGILDIAIFTQPSLSRQHQTLRIEQQWPQLEFIALKSLRQLYLVCGEQHPLLQAEINLTSLAAYPYLSAFNLMDKQLRDPFEYYCQQHRLDCQPVVRELAGPELGFHQLYRYLADNNTISLLPYSKVYEQSQLLPGLHVCHLSEQLTEQLYGEQAYPELYLVYARHQQRPQINWLLQEMQLLIRQNVH